MNVPFEELRQFWADEEGYPIVSDHAGPSSAFCTDFPHPL